jgi:perosamine synthetase
MEEAALEAFHNEKFVLGESVAKFEEEFAKYIGVKHAVSVNSGNSALQLSLMAIGISKNHNVVTSTNSFIASANCILSVGANPVLCDIKKSDGNLNVTSIKEKIDALIPVHIYGNPCDFDEIIEISEQNKAPIIEDACQAHGSEYKGKKTGSMGLVGCFSFYPTKNMTVCGDGGMVTTNDDDIANKIKSFRDNGRKSQYEHDKLGFTMRLNTINAAIGRVQLRNLETANKRRREIANIYRKRIVEDCLLEENPKGKSVFHQIVIYHNHRDKIIKNLDKNEIGYAIHYPTPIHKQPLYLNYNYTLPVSEDFAHRILSLPSYPILKDDEIKFIAEKVSDILN